MPPDRARTTRLAGSLWLPRVELAAVALAVLVLTIGAITSSAALVLTGAVLGYAGEASFAVSGRRIEDVLSRAHLGSSTRTLLLQGLLLAGAVRVLAPVPAWVTFLGLAAVLAPAIGQVAYAYPTNFSIRRHQAQVGWRNLPTHPAGPTGPAQLRTVLPVLDGGPALRFDTTASSGALDFAGLLLVAGIAVAVAVSSDLPLAIGAALVVVVVGAVAAAAMLQRRRVRQRIRPGRDNAEVVAAVEALAPQVVVYFSSPVSGTYALALWLDVIEQFHESCLVILREPEHLDRLPPTSVPMVVATSATDVEALAVDTVMVALYPTNVVKNNHLLRVPGIRHCFIGHGDSDKAGSYSPISRVYDEIWVAGQSGADRYAEVGEGVRPDQIVQVGRPSLAHVHRGTARPDPAHPVVLYAPTWEGFYDESDYSSLASMGERIVGALLDAGARVLFKAHPATGERSVHARAVADSIARRLDTAGDGNRAVAPDGPPVDELFDAVDVLVTDVSSVISDFLASSKPYLVTNPRNLDASTFVDQYPAAAAARLLSPDCAQLPAFLADAVGADALRERHAPSGIPRPGGRTDGDVIDRVFPLLLLGISYAGLAVAASTGSIWGFALAGLVTVASEVGLARRWARVERTLAKLSFDVVVRSVVVDIFVIVLAVQPIGVTGHVRAAVIGGVVLAALATGGYLLLRRLDTDQPAVAWRNLSVARARWWRSRYQGVRLLGLASAGPVLALLGDHIGLAGVVGTSLVIAPVVVAVALPVWVVVALAAHLDEQGSSGADDDLRAAALAAWTAFAPEVVIHFGGPDASTHVVNVWTPSLAAIPHRCAVIVRERVHLDRVEAHGLPVVYLPGNTDVEMFATASIGVAL